MSLVETIVRVQSSAQRNGFGVVMLPDDSLAFFKSYKERERFTREVEMLERFSHHPFAPKIIDVNDEIPYILLELIDGVDGKRIVENEIPIYVADCLDALSAVHEEGLVHQDVKEANGMFDDEGNFYLIDYESMSAEGVVENFDESPKIFGTPRYLSPESLEKGLIHRGNDVWAAGVMAYRRLVGSHLFDASSPIQLTFQIRMWSGNVRYEKDPEVERVLRTQLHPDYKRRISTNEAAAAWREIARLARPA